MKRVIAILLCLLLLLPVAACGKKSAGELVCFDGIISEVRLIHRMVKLLVEAETSLTVKIRDEASSVFAFNEMLRENCDFHTGYDGTLLTTMLKLDPSDVPEGQSLYDFANEKAEEKFKVTLLDKFGINNTYALAVPQAIADQYKLETISDLIPVADQLVFGAEHEFFSQEGSMKYDPFVKFYGLNFKDARQVDIGLKYTAVDTGQIQVTVVYTTDGMNKKVQLKVLEDDRNYFPEYNIALMVRMDMFQRFEKDAPNLKEVLNKLGSQFTNETMVELNYAVDVEEKDPNEVARNFLKEKGLLT